MKTVVVLKGTPVMSRTVSDSRLVITFHTTEGVSVL